MSNDSNASEAKTRSASGRSRVTRMRSVPNRHLVLNAVFYSAIHYLGIVASVAAIVWFFIKPSPLATQIIIASLIFSGVTWFIAFLKRRNTRCPLCRGTPLINSGALAHQKAVRWFPLNHGTTCILSIIFTHRFRCMYCGTPFDMLKTPPHLRPPEHTSPAKLPEGGRSRGQ